MADLEVRVFLARPLAAVPEAHAVTSFVLIDGRVRRRDRLRQQVTNLGPWTPGDPRGRLRTSRPGPDGWLDG